jgi:hypothetical protein
VGGADGVLTPTRNKLSSPVSRPDAAEGRECVPHDCGAVSMRTCNGIEQGNVQEMLLQ